MTTLRVSQPCGTTAVEVRPLAPRRPSLRGLRVAILDNSKPNADVLLGRVAELPGAGPVAVWRKPGSSHPATVIDEVAAAADVALTGSAD